MATKRPFVSDVQLTETLSKLKKKNEEEIELIGQLSTEVDQLLKEVTASGEVSPISEPPIAVTPSTLSTLVINSYVWKYKGDKTGWNPFAHTLVWCKNSKLRHLAVKRATSSLDCLATTPSTLFFMGTSVKVLLCPLLL
ncbi:hypothetical protein DAPPUDRAFT_327553 [Daphnia pulex]|uniref:Uncharacterized protein n=1 Tax=Daphnia pulex TaxID=6669 RepID=E9HB68_DAPPU|nr:hypothetical protein DAPPUDRAFT_327553 [Daphnia pulex]|eukprot:EFX71063.1 hypothetical protein DAPPUDRAFT_327553 [Daphnia pulex]